MDYYSDYSVSDKNCLCEDLQLRPFDADIKSRNSNSINSLKKEDYFNISSAFFEENIGPIESILILLGQNLLIWIPTVLGQ